MFVTCTVLRSTGEVGGGGRAEVDVLPDHRPPDPLPPSSHLSSPPPLSLSHSSSPRSSPPPYPLSIPHTPPLPHPLPISHTPLPPPHLPPPDHPTFSRFFPPSTMFILSSLSWGLLVELWFPGRIPHKVHVCAHWDHFVKPQRMTMCV